MLEPHELIGFQQKIAGPFIQGEINKTEKAIHEGYKELQKEVKEFHKLIS